MNRGPARHSDRPASIDFPPHNHRRLLPFSFPFLTRQLTVPSKAKIPDRAYQKQPIQPVRQNRVSDNRLLSPRAKIPPALLPLQPPSEMLAFRWPPHRAFPLNSTPFCASTPTNNSLCKWF